MPVYVYKVLTQEGKELRREGMAPNEEELRKGLAKEGLLVKAVRKKWKDAGYFSFSGVKPEDFYRCNQEVITLLKAGLTVPEALELAAERPESPALTSVLVKVMEDVKGGEQLSAACAKYPKVFDGLYLSSLKAGERTGNLVPPLLHYQEYLRQRVALRGKLSQAMIYPLFLLMVLAGVLGLLIGFVMPRFTALYADFGAALPAPTRVLMAMVSHLPLATAVLACVAACLGVSFKTWSSTQVGRLRLDRAKESFPLVGKFSKPLLASQLARTLSTLLSGGTPLTEALQVAKESMANRAYSARLEKVIRKVLEGGSLSGAMAGLLPRTALKLIEVGEASGQLEEMFRVIAADNETILEARLQRIMTLIEPVFILLSGILIGSVIVTMYLPIVRLSDIVK